MIKLVDCTLRDGGYYNNWDFSPEIINEYLHAMEAISVDYVEIGFRTLSNRGYKGPCGFSPDRFVRGLSIPDNITIGVMINAGEFVKHPDGVVSALEKTFLPQSSSPVALVRAACHMPEIEPFMPGVEWLKKQGYLTTINFMQIADRSEDELIGIAKLVNDSPLDVLYFADSMGSMGPDHTAWIIKTLRNHWRGDLGVHTHDNMGRAVVNTMRAIEEGVTWVDGTVLGWTGDRETRRPNTWPSNWNRTARRNAILPSFYLLSKNVSNRCRRNTAGGQIPIIIWLGSIAYTLLTFRRCWQIQDMTKRI